MPYKIRAKAPGEEVDHLPTFDFTKLSAINTCPRWGLIRYENGLAFPHNKRSMALEAGSACHEFFAAVRLYQLGIVQGFRDHMIHHGNILLPKERWGLVFNQLSSDHEYKKGDWEREALNFCLEALYSSGFVDDPSDRRRTMSNLEAACIGYFDRWNFEGQQVYVHDEVNPSSFVGVENPIDMVVEIPSQELDATAALDSISRIRFVGRIDGVHVNSKGELYIHENKTSSRLDEAWRMSFHTSHQVTGYAAAMTAFLNKQVNNARIIGLAIPRPVSGLDAINYIDVERKACDFQEWFDWFLHTVQIFHKYHKNAQDAPKYTHSCNRYFSPCPFISLCSNTTSEQRLEVMTNEMVVDRWSPLD